jgi:hypothetical protein
MSLTNGAVTRTKCGEEIPMSTSVNSSNSVALVQFSGEGLQGVFSQHSINTDIVRFVKKGSPRLSDNVFEIPFRDDLTGVSLCQGKQFLFWYSKSIRSGQRGIGDHISYAWFGGVDDGHLFLSQMEPEIVDILLSSGEKGFFEALKPEPIKLAEELYRVSAVRQGDIFAVPFWIPPGELGQLFSKRRELPSTGEHQVFNTHHKVLGIYTDYLEFEVPMTLSTRHLYNDSFRKRPTALAHGIIQAPDHAPVQLKELHLLAQTAYLTYFAQSSGALSGD